MRNIYILLLSLFSTLSFSQNSISLLSTGGNSDAQAAFSVQGYSTTEVEFSLSDYELKPVATTNGTEYLIIAEGMTPLLKRGAPDLPKMTRSFIIPDQGSTQLEIVDANYTDFHEINIAASYGNITRTEDPSLMPRNKGAVYTENAFFPSQIAVVREPYIYRDFRGVALAFQPFQYNPVTRTLRVYESIKVRITTSAASDAVNQFNRSKEMAISPEQHESYKSQFLNYETSRYTPVGDQGNMLIISFDAFAASMQPFIDWKRQTGMKVEIVNVSDIGDENAIRDYVAQHYATNNLSYLLLVGDIQQIPSLTASGGKSDPSYGYISGDDSYAEVVVGRMSAQTIADVETQVERSVSYEKTPLGNTGHFSRVAGLASNQGPGDDDEMDFEHQQLIRTKLLAYTYTEGLEFYDGSHGGADENGNPPASDLASALNEGIGLITYTGHGSATSFGTSGFNNDDVNDLQNAGKLPLIWSVGCVNGKFDNGTCFGETWLRATQSGEPTGAAGAFMSSINQSWYPPMCAQDEMVDILTETVVGVRTRSFGGISINGCLKMNDEYGSAGNDMTNTWHIFGDPSLMVRTSQPLAINVTHSQTTVVGANSADVNVDVENALVALVQNGILLGKAFVSGGIAHVTFDPIVTIENITVTVTAFNRIPYQGSITVTAPNTAFIINSGNVISDLLGNNNQQADYNEELLMHVSLENVGTMPSTIISAVMSSNDVSMISGECTFDPIPESNTIVSPDCFSFHVNDGIADQTIIHLSLAITDEEDNSWNYTIPVTVQAPAFSMNSNTVAELTGNNNGRPDANESLEITIPLANAGHSASVEGIAVFSSTSPWVTINENQEIIVPLSPQNIQNLTYPIQINPNTPPNTIIYFSCQVNCGAYSIDYSFTLKSGLIVEDAESGDFGHFEWSVSGDFPWFADESESYEGTYSFKSGSVGDNEESVLLASYSVSEVDSIRFYKKVLSENGYDYLRFYIDDALQGEWSGAIGWSYEAFAVSTGAHEFKWAYEKDDMITGLADASWVDFIQFPNGSSAINGIATTADQIDANVFPNPAKNQLSVQVNTLGATTITPRLFDQSGRLVQQWNIQILQGGSNVFTLPVSSGLSAGLYFLSLEDKDFSRTFKISVQP